MIKGKGTQERHRVMTAIYLGYSECRRIHCGLGWEPGQDIETGADLDLVYVMYDEYGRHIDTVSGKDGIRSNASGSIYHTGDDSAGADSGDDERITMDLLGLPQAIHYLFIAVEIRSKHTFGNIGMPRIRILKGVENEKLLNIDLTDKAGTAAASYIFIRMDRQPGGWSINTINEYMTGSGIPDWADALVDYLPKAGSGRKNPLDLPIMPHKGEIVPLSYTKQAQHRVMCGLSWDKAGGETAADLDLTCILYDKNARYVADVSSEAIRAIDSSGAVYHSGDDETGAGDGDDETISVELIKLPDHIHHAVFVVDMKTSHTLGQINNPALRIADGMTNRDQLNIKFDGGGTSNAYIFARLAKREGIWMLHYIGQFIDTAEVSDWSEAIKPYLK
jgi:tellurium resistance protein TerZ